MDDSELIDLMGREDIPSDAKQTISRLHDELQGCRVNRARNLSMTNQALDQRDEEREKVKGLLAEYQQLRERQETVEQQLEEIEQRLDDYDLEDFNARVDREVLEALEDAAQRNGTYSINPELLRRTRRAAEEHLRARRKGS